MAAARNPALPARLVILVLAGALGCSARDLSSLHDGVRSTSGGAAGQGAGGTAGGGSGGVPSGGTAGTSTGVFLGPWTFDMEAQVSSAEWVANTGKTTVSWIAEGETLPLGSLVVDGSSTRLREIVHVLDPTPAASEPGRAVDMSTYSFGVAARAATDATTLQLFAMDTAFSRTSGEIIALGTDWTTLLFPLNTADPASPTHDSTSTMTLGIICGPTAVWIDRVWLVDDAAGGAGGSGDGS